MTTRLGRGLPTSTHEISGLAALESAGRIEVFQYKYENKNRKIKLKAPPSNPTWEEGDSAWDDDDGGTWDDYKKRSSHWEALLNLVAHKVRDAKHLDSACMAGCAVFLTSDKDDIASKAVEIHALTGMRVFHFHSDWQAFLQEVERASSTTS